ncbi:hypothetical protein [Benzoatithermus flavus]|uniref:Uncharacterized protein n=1 Tax=Benzoatithermus flavus TaxID=3108223 RepID=A0ABU8XLJ6_9PROT
MPLVLKDTGHVFDLRDRMHPLPGRAGTPAAAMPFLRHLRPTGPHRHEREALPQSYATDEAIAAATSSISTVPSSTTAGILATNPERRCSVMACASATLGTVPKTVTP